MTLRTRASVIVSASFLALVALLLAAAVILVLGRFIALESDTARQNAKRAGDALDEVAGSLAGIASEWSQGGDAADFITGREPGLARATLTGSTFLALRLDAVVLLGPDGTVIYQRTYDRAGHHDGPAPAGLNAALAPGAPLALRDPGASHREGVLVLPGGIYVVAARRVTDRLGLKPPVGTLVLMRSLDAMEIKRIADLLGEAVTLVPIRNAGLSAAQVREAATSPRVFVVREGLSRIDSILPVRDVTGVISAALDVQGSRRVYREGLLSVQYLAFSLVACSLLTAALLFVLLSRMVLSPLGRLAAAVRGIGAGGGRGRLEPAGTDELSDVARSINGMLDALAASESRGAFLEERLSHVNKLEAIGTLAGGVAHDFNNILTTITGFCDLLEDSLRGRKESSHEAAAAAEAEVEQIRSAAARAASLTSQLMAFSQRQRLQFQVIDLNALLKEAAQSLRGTAGTGVALELQLEPGLARTRGDPGQLKQAILNLAANSLDAMPAGGTLTIITQNARIDGQEEAERLGVSPGSYVRCSVRDTGTGMEESVRRRVFEPFFTTKGAGKGTGLGLSVVWGVVRQCDGVISVTSEPGRGSVFEFLLPVTAEAGPRAAATVSPSPAAAAGGTVLVVEDEEPIRMFLVRALVRAGYRVLEASDGVEAMTVVSHQAGAPAEIRLLLTDVVMPRMSGPELARRLRDRYPGLKVLFMSGNADMEGALGPEDAGTPLLQKPFNTRRLVEKIGEILGG